MGLVSNTIALFCSSYWLTLPRGSGESGYIAIAAPVILCALVGFIWASADLNQRLETPEIGRWAQFLAAFGLNLGAVYLYFALSEHLRTSRGIWLD